VDGGAKEETVVVIKHDENDELGTLDKVSKIFIVKYKYSYR